MLIEQHPIIYIEQKQDSQSSPHYHQEPVDMALQQYCQYNFVINEFDHKQDVLFPRQKVTITNKSSNFL